MTKVTLKLQDQNHQKNHRQRPPLLLRAKIPITIFNFPFLSHFSTTTTHPSDHTVSLSTNFSSGPALKLSYATAASSSTPPLTLTLKSGTGLFGSPKNSPLVISANFSFNPSNPNNPNPTFSLLLKPQHGSFSIRKSISSESTTDVSSQSDNPGASFDSNSFGFVPLERTEVVEGFSKGQNGKDVIFKGIQLAVRTQLPVAKRLALNFRWWVNFQQDEMPVLRINKIGIERLEFASREDEQEKKKKNDGDAGEQEIMKSMCFWMKREMDALTRVNREMESELAEIRARISTGGSGGFTGVRKERIPAVGSSPGGFEHQKSKKNGGSQMNTNVHGKREEKKNESLAADVENELQRAIKAAALPS